MFKNVSSPELSNISVYFTSQALPFPFSFLFHLRLIARWARGTGLSVSEVLWAGPRLPHNRLWNNPFVPHRPGTPAVLKLILPNIAGGFFGFCSFPLITCPSLWHSETILITLLRSGICYFSPGAFWMFLNPCSSYHFYNEINIFYIKNLSVFRLQLQERQSNLRVSLQYWVLISVHIVYLSLFKSSFKKRFIIFL